MARVQASTNARGYGTPHRKLRDRLLAAWQPGDPCARCGQPMLYRWTLDQHGRKVSAIDLGHTADRAGYVGLEHRACNRGAGARVTNRLRRARRQWINSRAW